MHTFIHNLCIKRFQPVPTSTRWQKWTGCRTHHIKVGASYQQRWGKEPTAGLFGGEKVRHALDKVVVVGGETVEDNPQEKKGGHNLCVGMWMRGRVERIPDVLVGRGSCCYAQNPHY